MVSIMIYCMDSLLLILLERRELGYLVGFFHGTGDDFCCCCRGLLVEGLMTDSEI